MTMYKNKINKLRSLPKTGFFPPRSTRFRDPDAVVPLDAGNNSIEPPRQSFGDNNFTFGGGNVEMVRQSRPTITNTPLIQRAPNPASFSDRNVFAAEPIFQPATFTENIVSPPRPIVGPGSPVTRVITPVPDRAPNPRDRDFGGFTDFGNTTFFEDRFPTGPAQIVPDGGRPINSIPTVSSLQSFGQTTAPAVNVQELARQLANDIIAENARLSAATKKGRIYSRFERNNDIIEDQIETITSAIWSSGNAQLTTFFTSSAQTTSQRKYYVEVFNGLPSASSSLPQLAIAYGNAYGSGSDSAANMYDFASQAVYYQYRQLLLDSSATRFVTQGSGSTDSIYAITFNRSCIKERIDPGNFEFSMKAISGVRPTNATGSVVLGAASTIQTFIDDSSINTNPTKGAMGRVYNLVSGSLIRGVFNPSAPVYYGTVYPEYGVIVADGNVLDQKLNFQTNKTMNSEGNNHFAMFRAISGSAYEINALTSDNLGFYARNSERITSTHYFVRVKNSDYNFSNNPSYVSGSDGQIDQDTFIGDPKTYITTVGLYNDRTELIAVAKLSKPLLKSFSREALIRVKLDF